MKRFSLFKVTAGERVFERSASSYFDVIQYFAAASGRGHEGKSVSKISKTVFGFERTEDNGIVTDQTGYDHRDFLAQQTELVA